MVSDTEPRYRLVDANGNVVGSLFAEADGTLKLQEGTSGTDNELSFGTDGSLQTEQLSATSINTHEQTINVDGSDTVYDKLSTIAASATGVPDIDDWHRVTKTVGTSATEIMQFSGGLTHGIILVQGEESGTGNASFYDIVHGVSGVATDTISSASSLFPPSRSYSTIEDTLELAMASGQFDVRVRLLGNGGLNFD